MNEILKQRIEAAAIDLSEGSIMFLHEILPLLMKGAELAQEWISAKDALPEVNKDGTATENVLAIVEDMKGIQVMNFSVQPGENEAGEDGLFGVWSNCYGDINGDGEWDDQYDVKFWQPLPTPPHETEAK